MTNGTACLLWTGAVDGKGYGQVKRQGKYHLAHRLAFLAAYGYLPAVVRHACDTPRCVQPAHLLPGTQRDNVHDMETRGRAVHPRGEANGQAILTEDDVREIRTAPQAGDSCASVARRYGVSRRCIKHILTGTTWRHVV